MKHFFSLVLGLSLVSRVVAVDSQFFNAGTITNPIAINATSFVNFGTFNLATSIPYDTQNTLYFTNRGSLVGSVGYRFDYVTDDSRKPAANFINHSSGQIDVSGFFSFSGFGIGDPRFGNAFGGGASYLLISATNIVNNGTISVDDPGLLRLAGQKVDLTRGALVAGDPYTGGGSGGGFLFFTNFYINPSIVEDVYGGSGPTTNNIETEIGKEPPDNVFSPLHRVFFPGSTNGFLTRLPDQFDAQFEAFANTAESGTNKIVQVVFVNTNFNMENISVAVTFSPIRDTSNPAVPNTPEFPGLPEQLVIVEFKAPSFDPIAGRVETNSISFLDSSAQQTNIVTVTNLISLGATKPSGYEIVTSGLSFLGEPGNTPYTPDLIYPGATYTSNVVSGFYGGYSANLGQQATSIFGDPINIAPSNQAPRIEITADNLDMSFTRVRSEGPILIKAKNYVGRGPLGIGGGLFELDLGSTNGSLSVSNLIPSTFQRLRGNLSAWSMIWQNTEETPDATNNVKFHVLILDQALEAEIKPVIAKLNLTATNVVISDELTVTSDVKVKSQNLTIDSALTFTGQNLDFNSANFIDVRNFRVTTNGTIVGPNAAFFGFDSSAGYLSFTNEGLIQVAAPFIKARTIANSGTLISSNGSVFITGMSANLSNGTISSDRDVEISVGDLTATNSVIDTGEGFAFGSQTVGRLTLTVTNSIEDFGLRGSNFWSVNDGFSFTRRPFEGDLLGTEIISTVNGFQEATHTWPGQNRGSGAAGYEDNLGLGRLVLEIQSTNAQMRFSGTGVNNALYVVTLNVVLGAGVTNDPAISDLLKIDDNLTIYFLNSNAADKLTNAYPNKIVQVPDFGLTNNSSALVVVAKGLGVITPNLDGKKLKVGSKYTMKAKPASGHVFTGWSGSVNSASPVLRFQMVRNLVLEANFMRNPFLDAQGGYTGLFSEDTVRHESSGLVSFKVSRNGLVTGQLISGRAYRFAGKMDLSGKATIAVKRRGESSLILTLQIDTQNNPDEFSGTVSNGDWTASLAGGRAGANVVAPGQYSIVLGGGGGAPQRGAGLLTVDATGRIKLRATLSDGTRINQFGVILKNGKWPFYAPLYRGAGSIISAISFTGESDPAMQGQAIWSKTGDEGFRISLTVRGSTGSTPSE